MTAATKKAAKQSNEPAEQGVFVKAKSKRGFRRAGISFTQEWIDISKLTLSDAQKNALEVELALGDRSNLLIKKHKED